MEKFGIALVVLFVLFALTVGPLVTIWMLNTLFPALAIPYVFKTWLAALVLNMMIASRVGK